MNIVRYAIIRDATREQVAAYLPSNYEVIHTSISETINGATYLRRGQVVVIEGRDSAGWTLDGYVLPRLASGLYFGEEIDLSHPIMKTIPA